MNENPKKINITNINNFKTNLLAWAQQFDKIIWLDSNNKTNTDFDAILAVDAQTELKCNAKNAFEKLKKYQQKTQDFIGLKYS